MALLYDLLLQLDKSYSKPIKGLDEALRNCRREIDHGVKTDIWAVMEDFSKAPGGPDFNKLKSQYALFVDTVGSKQVFQYVYHMRLWITVSIVTDNFVYVVSF